MFDVDALTHYDSRLFLVQTLEHGQKTGADFTDTSGQNSPRYCLSCSKIDCDQSGRSFLAHRNSGAGSRSVYPDKLRDWNMVVKVFSTNRFVC